ncbi:hypothetical protein DYBT9275_03456 [Dyadobacter sp. CECT 9275]|uniref:Uncharacterized protein n=1 Tax=Dyadobacter helix TaxID=2822344 RepID=A0A916JHP3_9BACT|nr:hypothetical protein [Dyadobacter sp. CECT 9275]CAG5004826.1 hypothetical protein DYBT9275_03456 [Dyadobacter sp. CECT 9275]
MKKYLLNLLLFCSSVGIVLTSCHQDDTLPLEPVKTYTEQELRVILTSRLWRVDKIFKKTGTETVELTKDPLFNTKFSYRKAIFFQFPDKYLVFQSGTIIEDPGLFADSVETYSVLNKIVYPTNMIYEWDESLQTIVIKSEDREDYYLKTPRNLTGVLDQSSIRIFDTMETAKNAGVVENISFTVAVDDPEEGKSTYILNLQPTWKYGTDPIDARYFYYAIF